MILNKEQLIQLIQNMEYQDNFYMTIEKSDRSRGIGCFLRIVSEEVSPQEAKKCFMINK